MSYISLYISNISLYISLTNMYISNLYIYLSHIYIQDWLYVSVYFCISLLDHGAGLFLKLFFYLIFFFLAGVWFDFVTAS